MSTSTPQTERGHETPFVRQFSLFLPNRVGQLNELLATLTEEQVELAGISVIDSTDWAVVRMIFTDVGKARAILRRHGFTFTECDVLAVVLEGPETFQLVCKALLAAELNIAFAYSLLIQREKKPVLALYVDDQIMATQVLTRHGFTLLGHEDV
jgi:hypothetical protein